MLKDKARDYYVIGRIAEVLGMHSVAATNYFKALFAVDDLAIADLNGPAPKNHSVRFELLKQNIPKLYEITDLLWTTYRRTYTQELKAEELERVRKQVEEAFVHAKIDVPTDREIKDRFEELAKKGKILS